MAACCGEPTVSKPVRGAARLPSRQRWPADLLTAIAAHGARLARAQDAAICAWSPGGAHDDLTSVSTSRDRVWLTLVAEQASAAPAPAAPRQWRNGDRTLATVGLRSSALDGLLVVGKPGPDAFTADDLKLLGDAGVLVAAALEECPSPPAARSRSPAADDLQLAPVGGFRHRLPRAFERLGGLPALSESRDILLDVLDGPSPSRTAIVSAIESDVALLVAVLRLANEARGDSVPSIWSVPPAVEVLTPEGVETLARRIAVFDFFELIRGWTVPPEQFRLHAVATQRAAERLARLVDHPEPNQLMVAALLHDVGKLVLMEAFPDYPDRVLDSALTPEECVQAERRKLGLDHQMAGGVLVRRWRLPDRLAVIVGGHHGATDDRDAALVGLSDALAHYLHGQPVSPRELERAARDAGVTSSQLRTVMYELSQPDNQPQGRHPSPSPLTTRETEMLRGLAKGLTNKQIALEVGLSTSTVRSHLHNVYTKIGVADRAQAVLTATENCWV